MGLRLEARKFDRGYELTLPGFDPPRRKERAAAANIAKTRRVPERISMRTPQEAALAALAASSILRSAQVSTTTARLNVSTRPCSGMFARIAAGVLTAASCC